MFAMRFLNRSASVILVMLSTTGLVFAQKPSGLPGNYPNKPVRVIIPGAPGGGADFTARALFGKLAESWGGTFIPENVGGAGGIIAMEAGARASPDGYTVVLTGASPILVAAFSGKATFDVRKTYTGIAQISVTALLLGAYPGEPYSDLKGMVAYAKANPGKLTYGTTGVGSSLHLTAELIQSMTGTTMVHVPYKGTGPSLLDLVAGRINLAVGTTTAMVPNVRSGKIKSLGITSPHRLPSIPEQPTLAEMGLPGFDYTSYFGLIGRLGIPREVTGALNAEINRVLATAEMRKIMSDQGNDIETGTPEQFQSAIIGLLDKTEKVLRTTGIKLE